MIRATYRRPRRSAAAALRRKAGKADEAGLAPFLQAIEVILQFVLDGLRGRVEPEEALDIIVDRVRELDGASA